MSTGTAGRCLAVVGLLLAAGCAHRAPPSRTVLFKVGGTATKANVTYPNTAGGESVDNVAVPWQSPLTAFSPGSAVQLTAIDQSPGMVKCEIVVDGRTLIADTARGVGNYAACSATLP